MFAEAAIHLVSHHLRPIRNYRSIHYENGLVTCSCGVHGCDKQGKHPVGNAWGLASRLSFDDASLRNTFGSGEYNIAILVGQSDNIPFEEAVMDLESETDAGRALIQELIGDVIAPQWTSGIRRGETMPGLHSLFRPPTEFLSLPKPEYSIAAAGIDYLIGGPSKQRATTVPPSMHKTGVPRMWVPGRSLDDCEIPQLPYAAMLYLLDHVRLLNTQSPMRPRRTRRITIEPDSPESNANVFGPVPITPDTTVEEEHEARVYRTQCQLRHRDSEVYEGDRNNQMYAFACSLWRRMCGVVGINTLFEEEECDELVMDMLIAKNIMACQPDPLPDVEINGIFTSSRRFMQGELEHEFLTGTHSMPRLRYVLPQVVTQARLNGQAPAAVASVTVIAPVAPGIRPPAPVAPIVSEPVQPSQAAIPQAAVVVPVAVPPVSQTQQVIPVAVTQATVAAAQTAALVVPIVPRNSAALAIADADDSDTAGESVRQQTEVATQPADDSFDAYKLRFGATYEADPALQPGKNLSRRLDEWKIEGSLQFIDGCDPKEVALRFKGMDHAVILSEGLLDKPVQLAREVFRLSKGAVNLDPKSAIWPLPLLWLGGRIPGKKGMVTGFLRALMQRATVVHAKDVVGLPSGAASEMSLSGSLRRGIDKLCVNIIGIRNAHILECESLQDIDGAGVSAINSKRLTVSNEGVLIEGQQGPVITHTGVYVVDRVLSIMVDFDELIANRRNAGQPCPRPQVVSCTLEHELGFAKKRRKNSVQYGRWFIISVEAYLNGDSGDDDDDDTPDSPAPVSPPGTAAVAECTECVTQAV